jgi:hypothetical protein
MLTDWLETSYGPEVQACGKSNPAGFTGCGKSNLFCHSERSEESLFGLSAGKERFLGAQRASE